MGRAGCPKSCWAAAESRAWAPEPAPGAGWGAKATCEPPAPGAVNLGGDPRLHLLPTPQCSQDAPSWGELPELTAARGADGRPWERPGQTGPPFLVESPRWDAAGRGLGGKGAPLWCLGPGSGFSLGLHAGLDQGSGLSLG